MVIPDNYSRLLKDSLRDTIGKLQKNATLQSGVFSDTNVRVIEEVFTDLEKISPEEISICGNVFLASTSKLCIILEFLKCAYKSGDKFIDVDASIIIEALKRNQLEHMKTVGAYNDLLKLEGIEDSRSLSKDYIEGLADKYASMKFQIPIEEIAYLALIPSCNLPVKLAKDYLFDHIGQDKTVNMFRVKYEMSININNIEGMMWVQKDPNVGSLYRIAQLLNKISKKTENPPEKQIYDILSQNDAMDFAFNFKKSLTGQHLINRGFIILEKTGYMPSVYWVSSLSDKKPVHMVILSVITVINTKQAVKSYLGYQAIEVAMPMDKHSENFAIKDGESVTIEMPDFFSHEYDEYLDDVSHVFMPLFRSKMEWLIAPSILQLAGRLVSFIKHLYLKTFNIH